MTTPNKKLSFKIEDNDYEVTFPNNGEFIEIESMKSKLSRGEYASISDNLTLEAQIAKYTVDLIAFFGTCCPKVRTDLKVDSLSELDMLSSKKILKVYVDEILPWLKLWIEVINSNEEEVK